MGVALGAADHDEVLDWTETLGVPCVSGVDAESGGVVLECRDVEGPVPFVRRPFGGVTTRVLAELSDDGRLVSLSVRRRHTDGADAFADYDGTVSVITERLGRARDTEGAFSLEDGPTGPARASQSWRSNRLSAHVEVLRGMGPDIMVTEEWRWITTSD